MNKEKEELQMWNKSKATKQDDYVKLSSQDQRDEFVSTYDRKFLQ